MFRCLQAWLGLVAFTVCCILLISTTTAEQGLTGSCLGPAGTLCGSNCQEAVCEALGGLYGATNNVEHPWFDSHGWELTQIGSCGNLTAAQLPTEEPSYCNWYGVECCTSELAEAGACAAPHAVYALILGNNRLNGDLTADILINSLHQLHNCGLQHLDLEANDLWGSLTDELITAMPDLQYLNLGNNWLTGSIPTEVDNFKKLEYFSLAYNALSGTIPSSFGNLPQLQVLKLGSQAGYDVEAGRVPGLQGTIPPELGNLPQLRQLSLELNSLTGTLPASLCPEGGSSQLTTLTVQVNFLTGNATSVAACSKLMQLNLANNAFSGPLPASQWRHLLTYRAGYNMFTGTIPELLATQARVLQHLELQHNALTGTLPGNLWLMQGLTTLDISNNQISGDLEAIWFLPLLSRIDISSNRFVGTVNPEVMWSHSLSYLDISSNPGLSGPLPAELALLPSLAFLRATNTNLSCSGTTAFTNIDGTFVDVNSSTSPGTHSEQLSQLCSAEAVLPCFLQFKEQLTPLDDDSSMRCRGVVSKPIEEAKVACKGALPVLADVLPVDTDGYNHRQQQQWLLQPSYFQYRHCECLLGHTEVWHSNSTVLTCVPEHVSNLSFFLGIFAVMLSVAAVLVVALIYHSKRSKWLRERQLQAKRAKGVPKASGQQQRVNISIAVTDIQGYSDLTRHYPGMMTQAIVTHNSIMRKACHAHAGHVIHQEGDSWIVAFHEALDAVAFSLQVQQALTHKFQPAQCGSSEYNLQEDVHPSNRPSALEAAGSQDLTAFEHPAPLGVPAHKGNTAWLEQEVQPQPSAVSLSSDQDRTARGSMSTSPTSDIKSRWAEAFRLPWFVRKKTSVASAHSLFPTDAMQSCEVCLMVRIGVASGVLYYGCEAKNCEVKERARDLVCEAANGGQVLLDHPTFMLVKDSCSLLGTVTLDGYSEQLLKRMAWTETWTRLKQVPHQFVGRWFRSASLTPSRQSFSDRLTLQDPHDHDELAVFVHHGTFRAAPSAEDPATRLLVDHAGRRPSIDLPDFVMDATAMVARSASQPVFRRTSEFGSSYDLRSSTNASLQLYTVATPSMRHPQDRRWARPVRMQQGWVKTEKGYLDAPGARYEDLIPSTQCTDDSLPSLPEVAVVFVSVADEYVLHSRLGRRKVHQLSGAITRCLLEQLDSLPSGDGYLCRQMETDLKYMLVFQQPEAALQWCVSVQEALMYQDWPATLTSLQECSTVSDSTSGQILFKGPRLRMGVAVGQLNFVQPDQSGRADYFGECVNRAARYMGVAAHGGQVVTDLAVVHDVFHHWAAAAEEQHCTQLQTAVSVEAKLASLRSDMLVAESMSGETQTQHSLQQKPCQPQTWAYSSTSSEKQQQFLPSETGLVSKLQSVAGMQQAYASKQQQQLLQPCAPASPPPEVRSIRRPCSLRILPDALSQGGGLLLPELPDTVLSTQQQLQLDAIQAWHIGKFSFKGCGEYEMAHVLPSALAGRCFPKDPPKGKGLRLSVASGLVTGLPDVTIQLPEKLAKERYVHCQQQLLLQDHQ